MSSEHRCCPLFAWKDPRTNKLRIIPSFCGDNPFPRRRTLVFSIWGEFSDKGKGLLGIVHDWFDQTTLIAQSGGTIGAFTSLI